MYSQVVTLCLVCWGYISVVYGSCLFPFLYNGRQYYSCTTAGDEKAWCSIQYEYDEMDEKSWEFCEDKYLVFNIDLNKCPEVNISSHRLLYINGASTSSRRFTCWCDIVTSGKPVSFRYGLSTRDTPATQGYRWMSNGTFHVQFPTADGSQAENLTIEVAADDPMTVSCGRKEITQQVTSPYYTDQAEVKKKDNQDLLLYILYGVIGFLALLNIIQLSICISVKRRKKSQPDSKIYDDNELPKSKGDEPSEKDRLARPNLYSDEESSSNIYSEPDTPAGVYSNRPPVATPPPASGEEYHELDLKLLSKPDKFMKKP